MEKLIRAAQAVRERAYAPYSGYKVGAAVLDEEDRVWTGCNVENISYGLTICAERSAVAKMVSEGGKTLRAVAVATRDGGTPCGMCLQTLAEFAVAGSEVEVWLAGEAGDYRRLLLSELLPHGFQSDSVKRTD